MNVELVRQPPQSPDLNVLDLGLWTSMQARQKKLPMMWNEFELVRGIQGVFRDLPLTTIDNCFVTLQSVLREVKENAGSNNFKTPRKRKYAPPESDDELAFPLDGSNTETEAEDDEKPAALRAPRYMNTEAATKNTTTDETAAAV